MSVSNTLMDLITYFGSGITNPLSQVLPYGSKNGLNTTLRLDEMTILENILVSILRLESAPPLSPFAKP